MARVENTGSEFRNHAKTQYGSGFVRLLRVCVHVRPPCCLPFVFVFAILCHTINHTIHRTIHHTINHTISHTISHTIHALVYVCVKGQPAPTNRVRIH
jgi:hypothetical protein